MAETKIEGSGEMAKTKIAILEDQVRELTERLDALCKEKSSVAGPLTIERGLQVMGGIRTDTLESTNPLRHRMYPHNALIYQDIFRAKEDKAIEKLGQPTYDDHTWTSEHLWNDRPIIMFGGNDEQDGNGAQVIIPDGYDTVWVRVLGERWNVIKAYFLDGGQESLGLWAGGCRSTNCYCPDGTLSDGHSSAHQWLPIPTGRAGALALIAKTKTTNGFWISGLAFSKNPWAHAAQSAVGYHWAVNEGENTGWDRDNWHNDLLGLIGPKTNLKLRVPVVPSGRDKLLYLIEHNNNWNGCMHNGITVNDKPIERFLASYDNPFARHWNGKIYERYIAARIPAELIPEDARYLNVKIDMSTQNLHIYFREIGTHDLDIPRGTW
jgi:hypothetical protein